MNRCRCGADERDCLRQQQREQTSEPCDDRLAARYAELGITLCPDCDEPTHASESDDTGRCASCRACYYCDTEATRDGLHRWDEDTTTAIRVCEQCGDDGDRAQRLHQHLVREERI